MHNDRFVVLATADGRCLLELLPRSGGACNRLLLTTHQGKTLSVLAGLPDGKSLPVAGDFRNIPLYPFANRLEAGAYRVGKKQYNLAINEPERRNTLHGFLHQLEPEVLERQEDSDSAGLVLLYRYTGTIPGYPFPAEIRLVFTLSSRHGLTLAFSVTNRHEHTVPVGIGWHPYFTLGHGVDELDLQLPEVQRVGVDERLLPTGIRHPFPEFRTPGPIGGRALDTCMALGEHTQGTVSTRLWSPHRAAGLELWQNSTATLQPADPDCADTGTRKTGGFRYVHVFIPPDRQSIALEPVSCGINAFNTGENLVFLKPGQTYSARCGVRLFEKPLTHQRKP